MTRARNGFTLIELLIVVVIIGILAAIAIPKFEFTKGKANASAIKSDLRNMMSAQESYFYEYQTYASDPNLLPLQRSPKVVLVIHEAGAAGWSATATHPQAYPLTCAVYLGNAAPVQPADREGLIGCR